MELITTSLVAQTVKCLLTMAETRVWSLEWEDPLEKSMATHSSILAQKTPWMEERGPASGSFPMSHFFALGGQSIGVSASASVLPMNIQDWFPLGFTGWISLQSKGLSRVFFNTTVQKHQFFSAQLYVYQCFMYSCSPYKLFSYMFICLSHSRSKAYLIICIL